MLNCFTLTLPLITTSYRHSYVSRMNIKYHINLPYQVNRT
jgi:hypothetical protein